MLSFFKATTCFEGGVFYYLPEEEDYICTWLGDSGSRLTKLAAQFVPKIES